MIIFLAVMTLNCQAETFEKILGFNYDSDGVELQVMSGGCTDKSSFRVQRFIDNDTLTFGFQRQIFDGCLALMPYGTKIRYSYEELGVLPLQTFKVMNHLATARRGL